VAPGQGADHEEARREPVGSGALLAEDLAWIIHPGKNALAILQLKDEPSVGD
jgi:hypothetical protein